jgi:hypothetical protein
VRSSGGHRSTFRLLGSAPSFGWRLGSGALLGWALTLSVITFVFGLMTGALVEFINEDETYRKMLESMGMDMSVPAVGYVSYIAVFLALPVAAFLGWRVGATRKEEAEGAWTTCLREGWRAGVGWLSRPGTRSWPRRSWSPPRPQPCGPGPSWWTRRSRRGRSSSPCWGYCRWPSCSPASRC